MYTQFISIKKAASKYIIAAMVCIAFLNITPVSAQYTIVPSTQPDFLVWPAPFGYPNCANINYTPECPLLFPCNAVPNVQLSVLVIDGTGISLPQIFAYDQVAPGWQIAPIPAPAGSTPDVIVGNDVGAGGNNFLVGVVVTIPSAPLNDVYFLLYTVSNVGNGGMITPVLVSSTNISGTGQVVGAAHIDIIGKSSTPYPGGPGSLPLANRYAITWQDATQGIMGYYGTLQNPFVLSAPVIINGNLNLSSPDVAAVERWNPGTLSFEDWALFTYADFSVSPNMLYYQEWCMNPLSTPSAPVVYDGTTIFFSSSYPFRIDAIDDFNQNQPGPGVYPGAAPSANAFFDITTSVQDSYPGSGGDVLSYNNIRGPFAATNITALVNTPWPGLYKNANISPQVACGPGQFYTIAYCSPNGANVGYYATTIDWTTGQPTTSHDAYTINNTPYLLGTPYGVAVSASCNTDNAGGPQQLCLTFENNSQMWSKFDASVPLILLPTTGVQALRTGSDWQLYPNPATTTTTLIAPNGFNTTDGADIRVTDISGRILQRATMKDQAQDINVNGLAPGMYLLNVTGGNINKTINFVKE